MSSADLYEDGFPHGTKEGYDRGCRGSACPGALEEAGQTCATAKARYNGDYGYRKRVDAGMTPEQIRAEEPAKPAEKAKALHLVEAKPVARPKLVEPTPVAAVYQWPEDEKPATEADDEQDAPNASTDVTVDPTTGKTIALEAHGTHKGYWNGCRDINCPGVESVGKSCRAALNEYQAEKKRERIARAKQAERAAAPAAEEPAALAAPELSADELAQVTAFGLHEPEQQAPALAEWELELLGMTDADAADLVQPDLYEAISERDEKIRDLERELRWYEYLAGKKSAEQQRVVVPTEPGRTVTITIVVGS